MFWSHKTLTCCACSCHLSRGTAVNCGWRETMLKEEERQ